MSEISTHEGTPNALRKKIVRAIIPPLAVISSAVGAVAVGAEIGSVIRHSIDNPEPITPAKIVNDIKGGTKNLVSTVISPSSTSTEKPPSFSGFGGGKSSGAGAERSFEANSSKSSPTTKSKDFHFGGSGKTRGHGATKSF